MQESYEITIVDSDQLEGLWKDCDSGHEVSVR